MKQRKGFVSNSSSSSFLCDISNEAGEYDYSESPETFVTCENKHGFMGSYLLIERQKVLHNSWDGKSQWVDSEFVLVPEAIAAGCESTEEWLDNIVPAHYCPICQFDKLSIPDKRAFMLKELGLESDAALEALIRSRFSDYPSFRAYLEAK